jgi:phosphate starvation-inducible PhoH-like protein
MRKNKKTIEKETSIEARPKKTSGSFHFEFLNAQQKNAWQTIEENEITFLIGPAGSAKSFISTAYACSSILTKKQKKILLTRPIVESSRGLGFLPGCQPLSQKIATPSGWTTMGEIKIGDKVIGRDGMPTEVLGIYPKGEKDTYKVTTFDGTSTICCADHLWYTQTREEKNKKQQGKVRVTRDIISDLENGLKHFLPRNEPVHFNKKELPIAPYTLGVLLGDGCFRNNITFTSADQEIVDRVRKEIVGLGVELKQYKDNKEKCKEYNLSSSFKGKKGKRIKITNIETNNFIIYQNAKQASVDIGVAERTLYNRCNKNVTKNKLFYEYKHRDIESKYFNPIKIVVEKLQLTHKKAWEKFIPHEYKYTSIQDRIELLQGILDSDGNISKKGSVSLTTTSEKMVDDFCELVRSLGGKAAVSTYDNRNRVPHYNKNGCPIISKRIAYRIAVSLPDGIMPFALKRKKERYNLFSTQRSKFIAHIEITSIEKSGHENVQCIKVDNPEHLYLTDNFIVTHNTFEEKVNPYITPIYDALDELVGPVGFQRELINKCIQIRPLNYLRGCNFNDAICLMDEAQNNNFKELLLYITRLARNSKMIINGDPAQSDIRDSALMDVVSKLKGLKGVGVIQFTDSAIVRNPLISSILGRLS